MRRRRGIQYNFHSFFFKRPFCKIVNKSISTYLYLYYSSLMNYFNFVVYLFFSLLTKFWHTLFLTDFLFFQSIEIFSCLFSIKFLIVIWKFSNNIFMKFPKKLSKILQIYFLEIFFNNFAQFFIGIDFFVCLLVDSFHKNLVLQFYKSTSSPFDFTKFRQFFQLKFLNDFRWNFSIILSHGAKVKKRWVHNCRFEKKEPPENIRKVKKPESLNSSFQGAEGEGKGGVRRIFRLSVSF